MFSVDFQFASPSSVDGRSRPSSTLYTGVTWSNGGRSVQEKQISKTPRTLEVSGGVSFLLDTHELVQ